MKDRHIHRGASLLKSKQGLCSCRFIGSKVTGNRSAYTNKIIYSIKIQLKTLNILFNNLCLLEKKQSELAKQKMLSELTNKSFYDAQNLEDAINKKIKKHQLKI